MTPPIPLPPADLEAIAAESFWRQLAGWRIFFTGASGFFGSWLLESFLRADERWGLSAEAIVLTRSRSSFEEKLPHLARDSRVKLLEGDVRKFRFPEGPIDAVIHSIVPSEVSDLETTREFFHQATESLLELAIQKKSRRFLLCSTGAVYQTKSIGAYQETDPLVSVTPSPSYGAIRREVEALCHEAFVTKGLPLRIARAFSFVGPRLPLDSGFAIGNFLRNALDAEPIEIRGDGTAIRSYLYAADLATWLWKILAVASAGGIYNVGSNSPLTLRETAQMTAAINEPLQPIVIRGKEVPGMASSFYVPDTTRIQKDLALSDPIPLEEALRRTWRWHQPTTGMDKSVAAE